MSSATATDVQEAYLAYFGRPADWSGWNYWIGKDTATMDAGFAASAEYNSLYAGITNTQRVTQVYQNLLGRAPDAGGLAYWTNALTAGSVTVSSLVTTMQADAQGIDIATIANRGVYAIKFTSAMTSQAQIIAYSGTAVAAAARDAVSAVTYTDTSLQTADNSITTDLAAVLTGTPPAVAAAIAAANAAAAATAANNLSLYGSINGVTQTSATQALTLVTGANSVAMVGGSASVVDTLTIDAGTTSLIANISGIATGARELAWAGSDTALATVTVNDSSAGALTLDTVISSALTTFTVNNTGSALLTVRGITSSTLATLNIHGTGTVKENALALTGAALTINDTSTAVQTVVTFADANLAGASALVLNNTGGALMTLTSATLSNAGTLTVSDTGSSLVTLSTLVLSGSGAHTITESGTAGALRLKGSGFVDGSTGTLTFNNTGAGVLKLNVLGGTGVTTATTVTTTDTSTGIIKIAGLTANFATAINLGPHSAVTMSDSVGGAVTVAGGGDSSNVTLSITGSGAHGITLGNDTDTITSGIGSDTINIGTGVNTINGGGGADTINLATTHTNASAVYLSGVASSVETVTNFGSSLGTTVDLLNVTHTGNVLAGAALANETALATGVANLTAAAGYVFLKADGGTALTATTAAALFSGTTTNAGTWNIAAGGASQKEILIETGATTTSDSAWLITETSLGAFSAVKVAVIGVIATHDVAYANIH